MSAYSEIKEKQFNFKENGGFFAFGNKQFEENKIGKEPFVSLGLGLFCSKEKAGELVKNLEKFSKEKDLEVIEKSTIEEVFNYESSNYECSYTGNYEQPCGIVLSIFGEEKIKAYIKEHRERVIAKKLLRHLQELSREEQ